MYRITYEVDAPERESIAASRRRSELSGVCDDERMARRKRAIALGRKKRRRRLLRTLGWNFMMACCMAAAIYGASAFCGILFRLLGVA